MAIFLTADSKVIVQGMTGSEGMKHTTRMLASGTNVVGGVNPKKAGQSVDFPDGQSVPVFGSVADAIKETGADVSIAFVPGAFGMVGAILTGAALGLALGPAAGPVPGPGTGGALAVPIPRWVALGALAGATLLRAALADAVAWVARSLPTRPTAPILSGMLLEAEANITESQQFGDPETGLFFMRVTVLTRVPRSELEADLAELAGTYDMRWSLDAVDRHREAVGRAHRPRQHQRTAARVDAGRERGVGSKQRCDRRPVIAAGRNGQLFLGEGSR